MAQGEKRLAWKKVLEGTLIIGVFVMLFLVLYLHRIETAETTTGELRVLSEGWYRIVDGEKEEISLPADIASEEGTLLLFNDSLTQADAGSTITTRGAQYQLKILLGDELLYQYSDSWFPKNRQMKNKLRCDVLLPGEVEGRTLVLSYAGEPGEEFHISEVSIGSGSQVLLAHLRRNAAPMIIVLIMVMAGVTALSSAIYFRYINMREPKLFYAACFLLICAVWCITDTTLLHSYTGMSSLVSLISFYSFMLLAVPMLHFVQEIGDMRQYRCFDWLILAFYVNAILQGILNYCGIFEFIQMLFVTHILLILSTVLVARRMLLEYREKKQEELRTIICAFALLAFSGMLALVLYWVLGIPNYDMIFECGILLFCIFLLSGIVSSVAENVRFRTEAQVYQRLAGEDRLTGMKNRRSFDEFLSKLRETADNYENAAMIFIDLNRLKYVNDQFGHSVGDELIIAAGRCIENAYSREGSCYRIGGDEFCAVILNPKKPEEEWLEQLDREVRIYNKNGKYRISLARGISYLREKDGRIKSISDWKYQADRKMYEDKGERRRD